MGNLISTECRSYFTWISAQLETTKKESERLTPGIDQCTYRKPGAHDKQDQYHVALQTLPPYPDQRCTRLPDHSFPSLYFA